MGSDISIRLIKYYFLYSFRMEKMLCHCGMDKRRGILFEIHPYFRDFLWLLKIFGLIT
jgi:hypothetical protein